jgi:SOS-response transcriptional repressor LexA
MTTTEEHPRHPALRVEGEPSRRGIADFFWEFYDEYEVAPTYREIGAAVGLAPSTVHAHVQSLIGAGVLRLAPLPPGYERARTLLPGPRLVAVVGGGPTLKEE